MNIRIKIICMLMALPSVLCSAEEQAFAHWKQTLFLSDYCFIAEVVNDPDTGHKTLKPVEFFWGKHDAFLKSHAKINNYPGFPVGSLFFVHYTRQADGGFSKSHLQLKKTRSYEDTEIIMYRDDKKMKIQDFRKMAIQRPQKK
ncbi:hypothetical protein JO972_16600 [Verrucomicrobiaceae bacterium 5K15]|uniref:Uncharacterized protein n=1 Tax=Oceaniferula flava TaxID=2800421 RepID=A0AAE2VE09_9BACT|nr:hypothetical protein [Oceaniferula flavus]MBK1856586.1 hypothetical protein [Oceaniferula flavus]MBM1137894.1 hypothetical protein [Oceaniferula flavus]